MTIHVLLADRQRLFCEGARLILDSEPDIEVVGTVYNGREAVRAARCSNPDVVLIDITMPNLNGIEATLKITEATDDVKIIGLTERRESSSIREMFRAGARGYLFKECHGEELVKAVRVVADDRIYLSKEILDVGLIGCASGENSIDRQTKPLLSRREREVLQLVAEGHSTKEAASILTLSAKTVDGHRQHIMKKLGIHTVAAMTKYAIREGLTTLEI